jgi:hypothetical protein
MTRTPAVAVAASDLRLLQVSLCYQVVHDVLHGPLGDPHRLGDVAHARVRIAAQRHEDVAIVRQRLRLTLPLATFPPCVDNV